MIQQLNKSQISYIIFFYEKHKRDIRLGTPYSLSGGNIPPFILLGTTVAIISSESFMPYKKVFIQIEGQIHTFISNPELPKDLFMNTGIIPTIHNINHSRALLLESDNAKSTTLSKVKISESNLRM